MTPNWCNNNAVFLAFLTLTTTGNKQHKENTQKQHKENTQKLTGGLALTLLWMVLVWPITMPSLWVYIHPLSFILQFQMTSWVPPSECWRKFPNTRQLWIMNPPVGENTMEKEEDNYTKDGTVDYRGNPANRKKTGTWKACPYILGTHVRNWLISW